MHDRPAIYVLRVAGALDAHWAAWFAGLTMTVAADGTTTLAGPLVDQASLHGVLRKIRDPRPDAAQRRAAGRTREPSIKQTDKYGGTLMKITVLNGSPKGELSITMQYVAYLAKIYPQHEFNILHIAQRLKQLEHDPAAFDKVIAQVRESDAVLWGFPLYILIVHAHYKRFIELIFERGAQAAFAGKYTAALSTSIHFFDHTAHNYIHAICDDLEMHFVDSFSPDMHDLLTRRRPDAARGVWPAVPGGRRTAGPHAAPIPAPDLSRVFVPARASIRPRRDRREEGGHPP